VNLLDRLFFALLLVVLAFAGAASILAYLNSRTNQTIADVARYDVAIDCAKADVEVFNYEQAVAWYLKDRSPQTLEELKLQRQLIESRTLSFGRGYLGIFANSTQERIERFNHDPLTGLPNRSVFLRTLEEAVDRLASGGEVAVITIDLDGFKLVNDSMGHAAGDLLLQFVAARMTSLITGETETLLARLGGDEFVVLVEASEGIRLKAKRLAERIVEALKAHTISTAIASRFAPRLV
jgi:diguanylate cyclase (GGDEF)-like protein